MDIVLKQKLNLLVQVALADGHLADEEEQLIRGIARSNGVSEKETNLLFYNPSNLESFGALSRSRKKEFLIDSIALMLADGKITESERRFCQNVAVKLNYHKDVVDHILENWVDEESLGLDLTRFQITGF